MQIQRLKEQSYPELGRFLDVDLPFGINLGITRDRSRTPHGRQSILGTSHEKLQIVQARYELENYQAKAEGNGFYYTQK